MITIKVLGVPVAPVGISNDLRIARAVLDKADDVVHLIDQPFPSLHSENLDVCDLSAGLLYPAHHFLLDRVTLTTQFDKAARSLDDLATAR